ncbi:hypothetical protein DUNSADRAFT_2236 [Dunaliella salina]|uniref:Peptidase C19 ubiquitin carboxyl-terminal hydrolase domain-containing protein n=1 Tax=Dunaliella salina TaxID=3046 RepID=A0ABQ7GVX7_DUNSA|nr:hypothetical protein DUNSADRAFT_2236 [Dunaliella salina]|eukprot:KAF5838773.1 hypothetical protein DUNSADRAFT_2236 [Dunaliella salina]
MGSAFYTHTHTHSTGPASKSNQWGMAGVQGHLPKADSLPDLSPDAFPSLSASAAAPRKGPQGPWARPHMATHQGDAHQQEEEEDEELQRVLEASKQDTQLRGGISRQMQQQQGASDAEDEDSMALAQGAGMGPGLINRTGEYNCFLNVIIQCLWHLTVFKQKLQREVPRHESYRAQHPVVASLLRLFKELEEGEMRIAADPKATRCVSSSCTMLFLTTH